MGTKQNEIRETLVPLVLEMVLSGPQGIEAELIHEHGDLFSHAKTFDEPFIRVAPCVRRGAIPPDVFKLNLPNIENRKMFDHKARSSLKNLTGRVTHLYSAGCRRRNSTRGMTTTQRAVTTTKQSW